MLTLPTQLTIETASSFCEVLLRDLTIHENATVSLNAETLENITTPGIQVLLSLQKSLQAKNSRLHIIGTTPPVQSIFKDLGLQSLLTNP